MKLVALVAMALLPIALGIPVADNTTAPPKLGDTTDPTLATSYSKWRVTASTGLNCRSEPNTGGGIVCQYPEGEVITATCWTSGENIYGNPYWDKTTDGCYSSEYYLQYVSGYYYHC